MSKRRGATVDRIRARQAAAPHAPATDLAGRARLAPYRGIADAVVEACCLFAVGSLPLYFSVLTNTGFEPDKAVLARVLACVAAGAWLVGFLADRRAGGTARSGKLLFWIGLLSFLACGVGAVFSIDPRLSFFGSQLRQEGLVTRAAYAVFFVCAATRLRQRRRIDRLITVLLFTSVPVIAYGFAQQFGHDPVPSTGDISNLQWPVRSTFGQHVFLGSYLVMVIPFTASRLLENWRWRLEPPERDQGYESLLAVLVVAFSVALFFAFVALGFHRPSMYALFPVVLAGYALLGIFLHAMPDSSGVRRARLWGYALLLALQIVTLGITGARGPWLGFFATIPVFGFLVAWWLRRPRIWQSVLAASILAGLFLLVLNLPNGPLQPLRTVHGLTRISDLTESFGGEVGSVKGRLLIWQGVRTLLTTNPAIGHTWGGIGRDLVGYGPDTMSVAFDAVFPVKLRQATFEVWTWDRAHDIYMDTVIDAGLLALLTFLGAVTIFFRRAMILLRRADSHTAWMLIGMASAIGGHLVDGIFGIEMAFTFVFFWLILGFVTGLRQDGDDSLGRHPRNVPSVQTLAWFWGPVTLVLLILLLLVPNALPPHPALLAALWIASALVGVAVLASVVMERGEAPSQPAPGRRKSQRRQEGSVRSVRPFLPPIGVSVGIALILASQMQFVGATIADRNGTTSFGMRQSQDALGYLQQASRANGFEPIYALELGGAYSGIASSKSSYSTDPGYRPRPGDARSVDPGFALTLNRNQLYALSIDAMKTASDLSPLDAEFYANLGNTYRSWGHAQQAIDEYRRAERLSVTNPKYIADEAQAWIEAGQAGEAVHRAAAAVRIDPTYWYSHYALALAYHAARKPGQARGESQLALFWEPVTVPPPPPAQLKQMRAIEKSG